MSDSFDVITIKQNIAEAAAKAFSDAFGADIAASEIIPAIEYPPDPTLGDLAIPCFKFSRTLRKSPQMIAEAARDALVQSDIVSAANAVNGYLNIFIDGNIYISTVLESILEKGDDYGKLSEGDGKCVVLDYSSPNVAKPFHIGHLGTTVIGHALKNIHTFAGYKCVGVNHLGDWGTQFGKLIVAFQKWGDAEKIENGGIDELVALYVRFHKEAEADPSLEDTAREKFTLLESGDEECTRLWKWFVDISIKEYKKTYEQLGIEFDAYTGESFYYDKTADVVRELADKGLTKIDQGATIVDLEEYGMPPCMVLKSDGSTIYAVRDIAAALYRKKTYDFDKCIYVTSAGQSLHFAQWFKVIDLMGYNWAKDLIHVPYGTVSINGEKLATRTGNVILLKDLFAQATEKALAIINEKNPALEDKEKTAEAVGVGAIVFHYLSNNRIKDINFMLEDALSFEGNTGPYAQYTYARCCSIMEKAGDYDESKDLPNEVSDVETALIKTLSRFGESVKTALDTLEPMIITRFILDVCTAFNRFYHECRIVTEEDAEKRLFRIRLTKATRYVLGSALELICMKKTKKI